MSRLGHGSQPGLKLPQGTIGTEDVHRDLWDLLDAALFFRIVFVIHSVSTATAHTGWWLLGYHCERTAAFREVVVRLERQEC